MKFRLPAVITTRASRQVFVMQKNSPKILFVAGVVGVGATVVMACRATLKLEDVLTDAEKDIQNAKYALGLNRTDYTSRQYKEDMTVIYVKHSAQVAKLYAPAVIVGAVSIAALTGSHNILNKRNASLSAAYAAADKALKDYRERVLGELGEEKERELYYGAVKETTVIEDVNGPKKVKALKAGSPVSPYARLWGQDTSTQWSPEPNSNQFFLASHQAYLNDRLYTRGHVMLNDVFDALGLDRAPAGTRVGWLKDGDGDGYIDFGCWSKENKRKLEDFFMTGDECHIWLDFNVDGDIWDKI